MPYKFLEGKNFGKFGKLQKKCKIFLSKISLKILTNRKYATFVCVKQHIDDVNVVKVFSLEE